MLTPKQFQKTLLTWFDQYGRKELPWQQNKTPYRVWVSEIMLQQTQVATVIPYYTRFMKQFPSLKQLAQADLDAILHLWTGLGYYSRARNLHKAARDIVSTLHGRFPNTMEDLVTLPGIGPSTAGAILACAFNQQATILDGNVKRVLTRLYGIRSPITDKDTEKQLWDIATSLTPQERVADYTQAMMDLGATLCTRSKPQCDICPFKNQCEAYKHDWVAQLPAKTRKKPLPIKQTAFLIMAYQNSILLEKKQGKGVWQGLWSFPECDYDIQSTTLTNSIHETYGYTPSVITPLAPFRHTFSHYHLEINPIHVIINKIPKKNGRKEQLWYSLDAPNPVGLPQPVKRLLEQLAHANDSLQQTTKKR